MGACWYEITLWVSGWIIVYRSQSEAGADVGVFKNPFETLKGAVGTVSRQGYTQADTHFAMNFENMFLVPVNFSVYGPQGWKIPK